MREELLRVHTELAVTRHREMLLEQQVQRLTRQLEELRLSLHYQQRCHCGGANATTS